MTMPSPSTSQFEDPKGSERGSSSSSASSSSSSSRPNIFYGWQLLYYSIQKNIKKKSDMLIALAHFLITKQYNLRCVDESDAADSVGSELLPEHWNRDAQKYALHYSCDGSCFVLLAKQTRRDLIINLQNCTSKRMSITCLQPDLLVLCKRGQLEDCMPDAELIMEQLRVDLVDPVVRGTKKQPQPQQQQQHQAGELLSSATSSNLVRMKRLLGQSVKTPTEAFSIYHSIVSSSEHDHEIT